MATIKDVARLAGVGLGTASRVISGKGSVSPATAARVRDAIEQLGFRPSHAARSLPTGSTQTIGVYIPVLTGTFYTPILNTIDAQLRTTGQHMVVAFGSGAGNARAQALEGINFLIERGTDGVVAVTDSLLDRDIAALGAKAANLVVLNHYYKRIRPQCFAADHETGGRLAARALIEMGHRKVAIIGGPPEQADNVARLSGFREEMGKHGVPESQLVALDGDYSAESGWRQAQALLPRLSKYTALFCANDEMAVGALSRLHQAGISIPQELSVLGYDDTQTAEYSAPKLTSVHIPWGAVTVNGLNFLRNRLYGTQLPVERQFAASVTWRSSVARRVARRVAQQREGTT